MNKHLIIRNFGPIKNVDLEILDYNIFIGPQATGKSTIAKALYFFMTLKEDLWKYIALRVAVGEATQPVDKADFERRIRVKFLGLWGVTKVPPDFYMKFKYSCGYEIILCDHSGHIKVEYSQKMEHAIDEIFNKVNGNHQHIHYTEFMCDINMMFEQKKEINSVATIYIPAGRSIFSALPDYIQQQILVATLDESTFGLSLRDFLEQISQLKPIFNKPLNEVINEKLVLAPVSFNLDQKSLEIAQRLIALILKGKYRYSQSGEEIDIDADTSVKLLFASSGQQEALWILMLMFSLILNKTKAFVIIEEPEAHLFPEAQKYMTDLMSLVTNVNGNQIIITTHSPYILTSLNNHIYAEQIGKRYQEEVSKVVDPSFWMNYQRVNAYYVDESVIRSIMDEELHLIKAEEIDSASQLINNEFSKLADIE